MRYFTLVALILSAFAFSTTEAEAQFGVELVYNDNFDLGIGPRFSKDIDAFSDDDGSVLQQLRLIVDGVYYLSPCDMCTVFEINANGAVPLDVGEADVYAGAGLNYTRISFDFDDDILPGFAFSSSGSEIGLNIFGGLNFPISSLNGFAEAGVTLGGGDAFSLKGGILVGGN